MRTKKTEQKVYSYLLNMIQDGTLGPNSKIVEHDVAQLLGVSRSPVRSALLILEREGYLKLIPYKGAIVLRRQMNPTRYVEQLKVFELLFIQYLFQLEAKKGVLDFEQLQQQLASVEESIAQELREDTVKFEVALLSLVLSEQTNGFYKSLLLDILTGVLEADFTEVTLPEEDGGLLFFEHFKQIINYLKADQYPQGRREVRIFVNNLTLAIIDKQDLGQLNKYES